MLRDSATSTPTRATGPSTQETVPPPADAQSGPVVTLSRPVDQAAFAILASQVQKLSATRHPPATAARHGCISAGSPNSRCRPYWLTFSPEAAPAPPTTLPPQPQMNPAPTPHPQHPIPQRLVPRPLNAQGAQPGPQIPLSIECECAPPLVSQSPW